MKIFPEILAGSNFIRNFASAFEKQTKHSNFRCGSSAG